MTKLDYNQITNYLFIGKTPSKKQMTLLEEQGVELLINMRAERPPFTMANPVMAKMIWVPTLDLRLFPIKPSVIKGAAKIAQDVIDEGGKVYVFCRRGRHRSVAMGAAILIANGKSFDESIQLIKQKRQIADPNKGHIFTAIKEFDMEWKRNKAQ